MLLYLARHAQTASSAVDAFNGARDLPLTPRGREQAQALCARLASVRFSAVYRSPMSRTAQTAALVVPGAPLVLVPGLAEIDYGEWEGLSSQEAEGRDPARFAAWTRQSDQVAPPGGETAAQVAGRALAALEWIRARHREGQGEGPALAFCHKATLRILACALTGAPLAGYRARFAQDECALNLVELREGRPPFLRLWNDTSHLGPDPGTTTRPAH